MPPVKHFNIVFDAEKPVYFPGNVVSGKVHLGLYKTKKFTCIRIKVRGRAETHFTLPNGASKDGVDHCRAFEEYFKCRYVIHGQEDVETTLEAGDYEFPFNFRLPENLPSSFEGNYGRIRYTLTASIVRPWKNNTNVKSLYTVIAPVDLNLQPILKNPVNMNIEKTFGALLWKKKPLYVKLSVPQTGFVPGEKVPLKIDIKNNSDIHLKISLELIQTVTYTGRSTHTHVYRKKQQTDKVCHKSLGILNGDSSKCWDNEYLCIPPLPTSNLMPCEFIKINHQIKLECDPSGMHRDVDLIVPITIGTIPIRQKMTHNLEGAVGGTTIGWSVTPPPAYSDYPPPTYEECMLINKTDSNSGSDSDSDGKHTKSTDKKFVPMYPVFHFN